MKTHIVQQTNHQLEHDINGKMVSMDIIELQRTGWNLSMNRIYYKLTKRTKTEKYKKSLKTNTFKNSYITQKLNTICYKLTALSNIYHLIFT